MFGRYGHRLDKDGVVCEGFTYASALPKEGRFTRVEVDLLVTGLLGLHPVAAPRLVDGTLCLATPVSSQPHRHDHNLGLRTAQLGHVTVLGPIRRCEHVQVVLGRLKKRALQAGLRRTFTFHDIKAKSLSDFDGDKCKAAGNKSLAMTEVYDPLL